MWGWQVRGGKDRGKRLVKRYQKFILELVLEREDCYWMFLEGLNGAFQNCNEFKA